MKLLDASIVSKGGEDVYATLYPEAPENPDHFVDPNEGGKTDVKPD